MTTLEGLGCVDDRYDFYNSWTEEFQYEFTTLRSFNDYQNSTLQFDLCYSCGEQRGLCFCRRPFGKQAHLSFGRDLEANIFTNGNRNEASPLVRQEMESSGAGMLAATPLPENPYTYHEPSGMTTAADSALPTATNMDLSFLDTPDQSRYVDHFEASNLRGDSVGEDAFARDDEAARALNNLANWPGSLLDAGKSQDAGTLALDSTAQGDLGKLSHNPEGENGLIANDIVTGEASQGFGQDTDIDPQNAKAYAKLVFADGDLFITTHDVMLGRNMERFDQMRRRRKQEKRAREELNTYRKEPSQPSQPGDEDQQGDPSNSSQSLEGRPAPPSNFSEHGGPVWYPPHSDGEVEIQRSKSKRRISHFSKSSSTTSVAPANLHLGRISDVSSPYSGPQIRTYAFIPIHTPAAEDITKISKEHLLFSFNFEEEQWEIKVVGNRAFINETLFEKGVRVPLQHNDEIMIATVHMVFKLPNNYRQSPGLSRGTFSGHSEEEASDDESDSQRAVSTSPARKLSNALETEDSESEEVEQLEQRGGRKKPNLKLKIKAQEPKSKRDKGKAKAVVKKGTKTASRKEAAGEESPKASKKPDKGKKPKPAEDDDTEPKTEQDGQPPAAPFVAPGSALEGIPLEELPEKRKGPGRPPKEGNVSKRDASMANKKKKEYERRGEEPPSFKDLVAMVRREAKAKELQAKMLASGQLEPGADVLPSIEPEGSGSAARASGTTNDAVNAAPAEAPPRSPPRPRRAVRALSPVKPLEECTEEDLKKPDRTYVHILDEVLRNHSEGVADLPDIYERMQKRHPYFKYRCKTVGWQSSVRHNLQQSARFKDVGKAGKGKLWTVDLEYPLEKEKKRKATPPKPAVHSGQFIPGQMPHPQYGQAQYGNPYGQQQQNGHAQLGQQLGPGNYFSPYAQPGQSGQFGSHPQAQGPNGMPPTAQYPQFQPGQPGQQPPGMGAAPPVQLPQHMSKLVEEIIQFHGRHVAQFPPNSPEQERQKQLLSDVTEYLSAYFHDKEPAANITARINPTDHRPLYYDLEKLFKRYRADLVVPNPFNEGGSAVQEQVSQATDANPAQLPFQVGAGTSGTESAHQPQVSASSGDVGTEAPSASNDEPQSTEEPQRRQGKRPADSGEEEQGASKRPKSSG